MDLNEREYVKDALERKEGSEVIVAGWVEKIKSMGSITFVNLRDRTGTLQIVSGDKEISKLTPESVIVASGIMKKGMKKPPVFFSFTFASTSLRTK